MAKSTKIEYPNYTVEIDYFEDDNSIVIVVKDAGGEIIEGLNISDDVDDINPNLN